MNFAQTVDYQPTGIGLRWTVDRIMAKRIPPKRYQKSRSRFEPGVPKLRSVESIALWAVIGMAFKPMTKAEWLDAANIHGSMKRVLGASAISNLRKGHWVTCKLGLYAKREI